MIGEPADRAGQEILSMGRWRFSAGGGRIRWPDWSSSTTASRKGCTPGKKRVTAYPERYSRNHARIGGTRCLPIALPPPPTPDTRGISHRAASLSPCCLPLPLTPLLCNPPRILPGCRPLSGRPAFVPRPLSPCPGDQVWRRVDQPAERGAGRNRHDPGGDDSSGDVPAHRREALRRTDAEDGAAEERGDYHQGTTMVKNRDHRYGSEIVERA